jgi:hypothetical protein
LAQAPNLQSDEISPEAASTPVAHLYVESGNKIAAFAAASNGKLTTISGSPFNYSLVPMGANGHYLFGFEPNSVIIDSFSMAASGALKKASSTDTNNFNVLNCSDLVAWNGVGLRVDHSGEDVYTSAIPGEFPCYSAYQTFKIDNANGDLNFVGESSGLLLGGYGLTILGNNKFAYSPSCGAAFGNSPYPVIEPYERLSSGELVTANAGVPIPAPPIDEDAPGGPTPGYYCPQSIATDPTDHVAISMYSYTQVSGEDGGNLQYGPVAIAIYTADSKGNLTTTSNAKNMATLPMDSEDSCLACSTLRMSPSGKLLAAGGSGGVVLFHFDGGKPLTKYKTLLTTDSIGQIVWDNNNHMYAVGTNSKGNGELWVYTVTPTSVTEASGSPYSISNPGSMVIHTLP